MNWFNLVMQFAAAVSAGAAVTCVTLFLLDLLRRIEIADPAQGVDFPQDMMQRLPILIKICLPLTPSFVKMVRAPAFDSTRSSTRDLLMQCGMDQLITPEQFISVRIILGLFGVFFGFFLMLTGNIPAPIILILLLVYYPQVWLKKAKTKRHLEIQKALPNLLDLLTLSVEAGKDFLTAAREILRRRRPDALGEELGRAFHEIQIGKSRRDALKELSARVQQPDLSAVLSSIVQADELGVSIGQVLRIQGDQLRTKRFQRAEKLANEAPVKILIPMVFFILPAVFLILMAPLLLNVLRTTVG